MGPEFIVRVKDEKSPRPIEFEDICALKDRLLSLTLLWDTNCYLVNRERRFFIINGGRKIALEDFKGCRDLGVFYRRRHNKDLIFGAVPDQAVEGEHRVSYLIGFEGTVDNEEKITFLHVSPDGKTWLWKNHK